jgi:hypothetical protein
LSRTGEDLECFRGLGSGRKNGSSCLARCKVTV